MQGIPDQYQVDAWAGMRLTKTERRAWDRFAASAPITDTASDYEMIQHAAALAAEYADALIEERRKRMACTFRR